MTIAEAVTTAKRMLRTDFVVPISSENMVISTPVESGEARRPDGFIESSSPDVGSSSHVRLKGVGRNFSWFVSFQRPFTTSHRCAITTVRDSTESLHELSTIVRGSLYGSRVQLEFRRAPGSRTNEVGTCTRRSHGLPPSESYAAKVLSMLCHRYECQGSIWVL